MTRKKKPGKRDGSKIHDSIFYDSRMADLSFSAFRLFAELYQQYNGFNNGNLSTALKNLRFDWNEKTVKRAKIELLKNGIIEITRPGIKRRNTLYAFCHLPINECQKNGIKANESCTTRATGKREYFFPVRRDLQKEVREAIAKSTKIGGLK